MFPPQAFKGCVALTSQAPIDFTPADFCAPLSDTQQEYIQQKTGTDISQVYWCKQVHQDSVVVVRGQSAQDIGALEADALITHQRRTPIAVRTADCVPIFIYDPAKKVIGLAHAGWKGTFAQIAQKTILKMQEIYGCQWYDLWVYLGPALHACCYEVGHEFKTYFPQDVTDTDEGKIFFDIIAANVRQLVQVGLNPAQIMDSQECTLCGGPYHSFRRDKDKAGRMISLMMLL